jgi:hypothetical protein
MIENTASRCRIAFDGACVTAVSKLYRLGHHGLEHIMADLSRSPSQYFARSLCGKNRHWHVSAANRQEQHAYDIYTLLFECCFLSPKGDESRFMDFKSEARRHQTSGDCIHDPEECLEFLSIADECLRRRPVDELSGTVASRRPD